MRLLLDTHAVLWWLAGEPIAPPAKEAIAEPTNDVFVSAAAVWEIAIKRAIGKLILDGSVVSALDAGGLDPLPITARHAEEAGALPPHHRDPFDRMLIAQARLDGLTVVTRDPMFDRYAVSTMAC